MRNLGQSCRAAGLSDSFVFHGSGEGMSSHPRSVRDLLIAETHSFVFSMGLLQIPLPVTTGLFLYLGVSGLKGNEMWERTKLLITDKTLRPKVTYFWSFRMITPSYRILSRVRDETMLSVAIFTTGTWSRGLVHSGISWAHPFI